MASGSGVHRADCDRADRPCTIEQQGALTVYMGHLGVALGSRRACRLMPLWVLLVASVLPDLVDAFAGFTPWRDFVNLWSHTIVGIAALALAMACVGAITARRIRAALVAAALVASHLVLDFVTSDIPVWRSGPVVGAALYGHPVGDFLVELLVIVIGLYFYRTSLPSRAATPAARLAGMFACLVLFQAGWDAMLLVGA